MADESKGKGKSGGFRLLYYTIKQGKDSILVLLATIFDKADRDSISKKDALKLIEKIVCEFNAKQEDE